MGFCCVFGCSNRTDRNKRKPGIAFYKFPRDEALKKRWINAIRRKNWVPNEYSRICNQHFPPEMVNSTYVSGPRLRENAVPTIFPAHPKHKNKSQTIQDKNRSNSKRKKKVGFFSFPKDSETRDAWIRAIGRENWSPSDHSFLCSDHFSEDQIINLPSGLRKRDGAIPHKFLTPTSQSKPTSTKPSKTTPSVHPLATMVATDMNPRSCYVQHCTSEWTHKFKAPKDPTLRQQWETIIGRTDGRKLTVDDVVCEVHFMKVMIKVEYEKQEDNVVRGVKKLVDEAIPTIFPSANSSTTSEVSLSSPLPSTSSSRPDPAKALKKGRIPKKRKCCVPNCQSSETPSISFHQFPVQPSRRKTWLNLLNMSNFKPTKLTRVCSKHFTPSSFSNPGELRGDAIPKLYSLPNRKVNQELDPDSLLSEAQKTAAWLQSVKQRREDRKLKRATTGPPPRKIPRAYNPWGVKDCEVVIGEHERGIADDALSRLPPNYFSSPGSFNVPMPIVEVKEEPLEATDHFDYDTIQTDNTSSPSQFKPILPKVDAPQPLPTANSDSPLLLAPYVPQFITGNNFMIQKTVRSASEAKAVQEQPLSPSTIYRVIIPTTVEGHAIQTEEIVEQLKDKIKAMHNENFAQKKVLGSPVVPKLSKPATPVTLPSTPIISKTASLAKPMPLSVKTREKVIAVTGGVKTSRIIFTETIPVPPVRTDHAYATKPPKVTASWPVIVQTPVGKPGPKTISIPTQASPPSGPPSTAPVKPLPPTNVTKSNTPVFAQPALPPLTLLPAGTSGTMNILSNAIRMGETPPSVSLRTQSTQTPNSSEHQLAIKQLRDLRSSNESYRSTIKTLRQVARRAHDRLLKTTKELDDLKSRQAPIEMDKGKENIIVIETTDKCDCLERRRDHEDVGDILNVAAQRKIPPPDKSKTLLLANEKLIKKISSIKKRLNHKDILRVVVFQTEDLLSVV